MCRDKIRGAFVSLVGIFVILSFFLLVTPRAVPTGSVARAPVSVPIIMYHSILKDPAKANLYVISPALLESDLIYLQKHGYTTVVVADLIAYVERGESLPRKPVMLTFDDAHYNFLTYALPLLEKYQMRAVVSAVGSYAETYSENKDPNPNYAYLSWEDLSLLDTSGLVEVQNHSYALHENDGARDGVDRMPGEDLNAYFESVGADLRKMQDMLWRCSHISATAFTYPFGSFSKDAEALMRRLGFRATFSCSEKINSISDAESLYALGRFNRASGISTEEFMKRIVIPK